MHKIFRKIFIIELNSVRDFYLFSILFAIIVVVFSLTFLLNDYFSFKRDVIADVREQNERVKSKINDSVSYTSHLMKYIARQIAYREGKDLNFIQNLMQTYRIADDSLMSWIAFSWVNQNLQLVASSSYGIIAEPLDLSKREYLALTKSYPQTIQMGLPVLGALSAVWQIPLGYGVVDKNHNYLGSVVTGIDLSGLKADIENSIIDKKVSFALVDLKGEVILKSDSLDIEENKILFDKFLRYLKKKGSKNSFVYKNTYYQKLGEYPYGIITTYGSKFFSEGIENRFIIYLIVMFSIIAFAGFIFYVFNENVVGPISQLAIIARQVNAGRKIDKIPQFNVAEINDLGKALQATNELVSDKNRRKNLDL